MKTGQSYALETRTPLGYAPALDKVVELLKEEGFGILTEVDVQATIKAKLGLDFKPYKILGACNPPLAHQTLQAEPLVGVFLPCNVVVYEAPDGETRVAAMDPRLMARIMNNDRIGPLAEDVATRLERVLKKMETA